MQRMKCAMQALAWREGGRRSWMGSKAVAETEKCRRTYYWRHLSRVAWWWSISGWHLMGPVRIRHSSHDFGWQSSHSVDLAGWQAKMASIEIWIPWCSAHKAHLLRVIGSNPDGELVGGGGGGQYVCPYIERDLLWCLSLGPVLLPWPKKSLQPRYSWDWSAVRSCDISRHRLRSATRARDAQLPRVASLSKRSSISHDITWSDRRSTSWISRL